MNESHNNRRPDDGPQLRPHTYDGIQEFDQRLPNWWLFTLYIAIAFAAVYWLAWYQFGVFNPDGDRVDAEVYVKRTSNPDALALLNTDDQDRQLWQMSRDAAVIERGKVTFEGTCAACHGKDLSATLAGVKLPGLPLNDKEWKHGARPQDVLKVVTKGAPDPTKGMPAWELVLGRTKCTEAVAFVLSHHEPPAGLLDKKADTAAPAPAANAAPAVAPSTPAPAVANPVPTPAAAPAAAPAPTSATQPAAHDPVESEFLKK